MKSQEKKFGKKGQTVLTVFFVLILFWVLWIFFIAPLINAAVDTAETQGQMNGLELFLLRNLVWVFGFFSLLVLFWAGRSGVG